MALENKALEIIFDYLDIEECRDVRLTYEALKCLASLIVHRKCAWEFIANNGVQRILKVNRISMASTGVATCMFYMAYTVDMMERVCQLPDSVLDQLVE